MSKEKIRVKYKGMLLTFDELAMRTGIKRETIKSRYYKGYRGNDLGRKNLNMLRKNVYEIEGLKMTGKDIERYYGVDPRLVSKRYYKGWRGRELIEGKGKQSISVYVNGIKYNSLNELARAYGISDTLVKQRYREGYRGMSLVQRKNYNVTRQKEKAREDQTKIKA